MNIAQFLEEISSRVGIEMTDEIQAIISNPNLNQINVPSSILNSYQSKLMTEDEAKRNLEIKRHFTGTALNAVDKKMSEVLDSFGLDEDVKNVIMQETNTYNRIPLLAKAISETKEKAISATGGEKKALLDKVNELQSLLNNEREGRKVDIDNINSKWQSQLTDKELNSMFNGYDYALDLDKDVTITTARNLWEKKLREKGGKYIYTNEGIKLVNAEAQDLPFTIDNKTIDVKSFTDNVLAEAKLLKVNKPNNSPVGNIITQTPLPVKVAAPAAKNQTSKALADFKAGSTLV
jgi:hypothetical protein